jgi:hypothetical protein
METLDCRERWVSHPDFADLLERHARSLRLVFLSACESARVANTAGFTSLGQRLLQVGFPAVLAMQHSVFNKSAIAFSNAFYREAVQGRPLQEAAAAAREAMQQVSPNGMDFATAVLYLSDPVCLQATAAELPDRPLPALDLTGVTAAERFVGRAVELHALQTRLDPQDGDRRAAVIFSMGGMGKTALAARLAARMSPRLDGVISIRMNPSTTSKEILDHLAGYLLVNNARFNLPEINQLNAVKDQPLPVEQKAALLIEILQRKKLLVLCPGSKYKLKSAPISLDKA